MDAMDPRERLQLEKLISANDVEDVTQDIRNRKHSMLIKEDIDRMMIIKRDYARLATSSPETFDAMLVSKCNFLFTNYFDIFNRVKKNELNLQIMGSFITVLKQIEDGELDQHTGAYQIGKLLKELYIDSAITRGDRLDEKHTKNTKAPKRMPAENISWKEYKEMNSKAEDR